MKICSLLQDFDGKHTASLRCIGMRLEATQDSVAALLAEAMKSKGGSIEIGSTWLVKYLLEKGVALDHDTSCQVVSALGVMKESDSKLHLLQSLPHLHWNTETATQSVRVVEEILNSETHKFVRAWAYNALGLIAATGPSQSKAIVSRLKKAMKTESASVRVRIRKVLERIAA